LITGAVLAGGRSVRFGRNKALHQLGGRRFIEHAVESLSPFCDPVLVVVNEVAPYLDLGFTLVRDIIPHQGPLGGIYTALVFSINDWVFVKATDMPFLVPELASMVIEARKGFDAVVPRLDDYYEPLLALYHRRCFPIIAQQLNNPDDRQIIKFYQKIKVRSIREDEWRKVDPEGLSFKNVNTQSDLAEFQWT
jgi:molybdenum cofactor guanylyltransferase